MSYPQTHTQLIPKKTAVHIDNLRERERKKSSVYRTGLSNGSSDHKICHHRLGFLDKCSFQGGKMTSVDTFSVTTGAKMWYLMFCSLTLLKALSSPTVKNIKCACTQTQDASLFRLQPFFFFSDKILNSSFWFVSGQTENHYSCMFTLISTF